jgi:hypothetical protein
MAATKVSLVIADIATTQMRTGFEDFFPRGCGAESLNRLGDGIRL